MKRISKLLCFSLCIFILISSFSGCKSKKSPSPSQLTKQIIEESSLSNLSFLSGDKLESYFGFKNSDLGRFSVLISSLNRCSDTVAVFEVKSEESKALIISGISKYASNLEASMKLVESEKKKLSSRLILQMDNLIILIICAEAEEIEQNLTLMGAQAVY